MVRRSPKPMPERRFSPSEALAEAPGDGGVDAASFFVELVVVSRAEVAGDAAADGGVIDGVVAEGDGVIAGSCAGLDSDVECLPAAAERLAGEEIADGIGRVGDVEVALGEAELADEARV